MALKSANAEVQVLVDTKCYFRMKKSKLFLIAKYKKGDTFTVGAYDTEVDKEGNTIYWVQNKQTGSYSILADEETTYLKIIKDNGNPEIYSGSVVQTSYTDEDGNAAYFTIDTTAYTLNSNYTSGGDVTIEYCIPRDTEGNDELSVPDDGNRIETYSKLDTSSKIKVANQQVTKGGAERTEDVRVRNEYGYPQVAVSPSENRNSNRYVYDYTINVQGALQTEIQKIRENLNIQSAYSREELNKKYHQMFNRFHVHYPDYFLNNTIGYVFFTRPDLNLFDSDWNMLSQISNDPQMYYIVNANRETARLLTRGYSSRHHLNPLLSNTVTSLDVSDEAIETLETGETFTGFKTQYAKSNIRSLTAGTISLKFPETYNMAITHMHQLWCGYESGVYRGTLKPRDKYIWYKEIDYACDIYYFLVDVDSMILRYWCKYTGCFPLNVNKSVYSYDADSQISHPDLSVTYAFFAREDLDPRALNEFNNNTGGNSNGFKYKAEYIPKLGSGGNTWSGSPYIMQTTRANGISGVDSQLFALRFRE